MRDDDLSAAASKRVEVVLRASPARKIDLQVSEPGAMAISAACVIATQRENRRARTLCASVVVRHR